MILRGRADDLFERHELRQGRHLIVRHLDIHVVQRRRIQAVLRCRTYPELIDLAELVEVTYIRTAAVRAKGVEYRLGGGSCALALYGIDVHLVFRIALREGGHRAGDLRTLHQFDHKRIRFISEIGEIPVAPILHLQVNAVGCSVSRNLRHLERKNLCIFNRQTIIVETLYDIVDIMLVTLTLVPILETDDERGITRSVG